ncbi:hypothetical protein TMatcc_003431 [Talaromyces marneffei ATCC 18224]
MYKSTFSSTAFLLIPNTSTSSDNTRAFTRTYDMPRKTVNNAIHLLVSAFNAIWMQAEVQSMYTTCIHMWKNAYVSQLDRCIRSESHTLKRKDNKIVNY